MSDKGQTKDETQLTDFDIGTDIGIYNSSLYRQFYQAAAVVIPLNDLYR